MERNKQLIQNGFDQWAIGSASFFDLLADDVTWTITGNSPISKVYISRKQFLDEAITPINERLSERIIPSLRGLYAEGDMVIAIWDGKATAKDGISYNNSYSWYMRVKEDKIIEVIAFFDSIELADLWKRLPDTETK
ncbi:MAG: nuclear transport factor 2 family protein [Algoriphagus sp.]|nr:nuclear transport factor 2 family protein [Algoriphagus sp.]